MSETKMEFETNPIDEEFSEEGEDEEVTDCEEEEIEEIDIKANKNTLELDFSMDPVKRLSKEIEFTNSKNQKHIGNYLLEQFSHDEPLMKSYQSKKMTLSAVAGEIMRCASNKLSRKPGFISDDEVYGWIIHFVQDGENKLIKAETESYKVTKQDAEEAKKMAIHRLEMEEVEKLRKQKETEEKKLKKFEEKAAKTREESGQMSLFECL